MHQNLGIILLQLNYGKNSFKYWCKIGSRFRPRDQSGKEERDERGSEPVWQDGGAALPADGFHVAEAAGDDVARAVGHGPAMQKTSDSLLMVC